MKQGTISVKNTDIFPIIKKWLYSEHDIFFRELISNASDAITKRNALARLNGYATEEGKIEVIIDKNNKTLTFIDNGIGMTEAEVEKYIAQLAFSGAEEFVSKVKDTKDEIIGKFGLGFYSSFMVADKVVINSLSSTPGSIATQWSCEGNVDYSFSTSNKNTIGTEITLHLNKESEEFLNSWKTRTTLKNYCDFMPYPILLTDLETNKNIMEDNAKATKEEDKKPLPHDIINSTQPLWKKDPTTLNDEDYINFYRELYPMDEEPLFWLHLNIDHPFTLQGILYFPKVNMNKPIQEKNIKLYCKQVYVSDTVKNIVPEFLGLLKGAIDSTDIPLNVSRSALQGDPNVKKISNYIIKKVAESLKKLYNTDRARYEKIWNDISLFVKYGCVSDNKFDEMMRDMVFYQTQLGKLMTLAEYKDAIPAQYKEKLADKIIYGEKNVTDINLINQMTKENIPVIETDNYIDPHFMQHTEMHKVQDKNFKFVSVDSEIENLLSEAVNEVDMKVKDFFETITKDLNLNDYSVDVKNLKNQTSPAYLKVDENMKRFQQMTAQMGNAMAFPVKKTLVVNPQNQLIQNAYKLWDGGKNKDLAKKLGLLVMDLASISSEGLKAEEKEKFVTRSQELLGELTNLAL
jgi:molecular chaperone HtpG